MAGGGGSSVQSAPDYIQDWHNWSLSGSTTPSASVKINKYMAKYLNEYLDPNELGSSEMAERNPFAVHSNTGNEAFTKAWPRINQADHEDYKEYLDYFRKGNSQALEQYITAHIASLDTLMNTEAADVMEVASRGIDQLFVDFPELNENVVDSLGLITSSILNAVNAYLADPAFDTVYDTYNTRVEEDRDRQISHFKNGMGMQDASLSSAFNTGLGMIYEETVRKEGEYAAQIQLELFTKSFTQFIQAYLGDYQWIKNIKAQGTMNLAQFVMQTFDKKLNKNAFQSQMYDGYIKLAMTGMHDYFSYVQATRMGFYQWPYEVFQFGANFMSAAMGGNVPTQKFTKAQSAFSGAAAGAGIGTAIAPGIGTAIGAGVGAIAGLLSG